MICVISAPNWIKKAFRGASIASARRTKTTAFPSYRAYSEGKLLAMPMLQLPHLPESGNDLLCRVVLPGSVLTSSPGLLPQITSSLFVPVFGFWVIRQPLVDLHVLTVTGLGQVT